MCACVRRVCGVLSFRARVHKIETWPALARFVAAGPGGRKLDPGRKTTRSQEIHLYGLIARPARHTRLFWASLIATFALAAVLSTDAFAAGSTLYVSPKGKDTAKCSKPAPCKTIGHTVSIAKKGDTISVASGTYREQVAITKDVSLLASGHPVIDATGESNGILLQGPRGQRRPGSRVYRPTRHPRGDPGGQCIQADDRGQHGPRQRSRHQGSHADGGVRRGWSGPR